MDHHGGECERYVTELEHQAAENEAAIRALHEIVKDLFPEALVHTEHAAAIQRAIARADHDPA